VLLPPLSRPPRPDAPPAVRLGWALRQRRDALPLGQRRRSEVAEALGYSLDRVKQVEIGTYPPSVDYMTRWVKVYGELDDELAGLWNEVEQERAAKRAAAQAPDDLDLARGITVAETDYPLVAIDIARRAGASDLGVGTVEAVLLLVDHLCRAYASTPPDELRRKVVRHLWYVGRLLERRLTVDQRRELLVAAGWLALLGACTHFDLHDHVTAEANRIAAFQLGQQTGHQELMARSLETKAWFALTTGDAKSALELVHQGKRLATPATGASVQLAVQEARARARLGDRAEVRRAIDAAARELATLPTPEHPEHHFVFDATKLVCYAASSYAWVGDGELAEEHAREVIAQCEDEASQVRWPRRRASAQIDLGVALVQLNRPDEAAYVGSLAVGSKWLVPSNQWRAVELDRALTTRFRGVAEVQAFHEQVELMRRGTELDSP
jgi:transcriptional regulator with XRE-family HTH domain